MSRPPHLAQQIGVFATLITALGFGLSLRAVAAQPPVDIRGQWALTTTVGTTKYPQTLDITSEDFASGQIQGTDTGSGGATFTVAGTVSGDTITMTISDASYRSNVKATITATSPTMSMSGTFSDSHNAKGTLIAYLTIPATTGTLPLSGSSVVPTATPGAEAPADTTAAVLPGVVAPPDSGSTDNLPLVPIGVAALLLLGIGIAAATTGLLPGIPGLGGSATTTGGGQGETVADNTAGQQIERSKIMQDTRPSIMPSQQDVPMKPAQPDPLGLPGEQQPPTSGQQTERHSIMQDVRPSIMPIQQDPPVKFVPPSSGPATSGHVRAEAPSNPITDPSVASSGDLPIDEPPIA
jgi:hypothetical protein